MRQKTAIRDASTYISLVDNDQVVMIDPRDTGYRRVALRYKISPLVWFVEIDRDELVSRCVVVCAQIENTPFVRDSLVRCQNDAKVQYPHSHVVFSTPLVDDLVPLDLLSN